MIKIVYTEFLSLFKLLFLPTVKNSFANLILILILLFSLSSCFLYDEATKSDNLLSFIGYCPTMEDYAKEYAKENNMVPVKVDTTSVALQNLKQGNLDAVIVGRKAHRSEITPATIESQLEDGYTLISNNQNLIQEFQLSNYIIHTYIDSEIAKELIPNSEIVYYENFENALVNGISGYPNAMLIDWRDYKDNFPLLIPMRGNSKVPEFRTPFLYTVRE